MLDLNKTAVQGEAFIQAVTQPPLPVICLQVSSVAQQQPCVDLYCEYTYVTVINSSLLTTSVQCSRQMSAWHPPLCQASQ